MFNGLIDWYLDRRVQRERSALPRLDWRSLLKRIQNEVDGYAVFVETRDGQFVAVSSSEAKGNLDAIGLVAAWVRDDVPPWEMEAPARRLTNQLSALEGTTVVMLLSRRIEPFAGYYVRLRPKRS
jgi:hypothetical protein